MYPTRTTLKRARMSLSIPITICVNKWQADSLKLVIPHCERHCRFSPVQVNRWQRMVTCSLCTINRKDNVKLIPYYSFMADMFTFTKKYTPAFFSIIGVISPSWNWNKIGYTILYTIYKMSLKNCGVLLLVLLGRYYFYMLHYKNPLIVFFYYHIYMYIQIYKEIIGIYQRYVFDKSLFFLFFSFRCSLSRRRGISNGVSNEHRPVSSKNKKHYQMFSLYFTSSSSWSIWKIQSIWPLYASYISYKSLTSA